MSDVRIDPNLKFSETLPASISDFFHMIFEYFVLFKWSYFKNNPRGNLLLVRAFLVMGLIATIYYSIFSSFDFVIQGIEVDPILVFAFAITIGYWYMGAVFHKKSEFCANLYMNYLEAIGRGEEKTASLLGMFLSSQLLALDLWAHRSYANVLSKNLTLAIEHSYADDIAEQVRLFERINSGKMQVREARLLLQRYKAHLMS